MNYYKSPCCNAGMLHKEGENTYQCSHCFTVWHEATLKCIHRRAKESMRKIDESVSRFNKRHNVRKPISTDDVIEVTKTLQSCKTSLEFITSIS